MKKIILFSGLFLIAFVIFSSVITPPAKSYRVQEQPATHTTMSLEKYTIKSENGKIVVYLGDALYLRTSTATSTLPKQDQKTLLYGITVTTKEEMKSILESYCS